MPGRPRRSRGGTTASSPSLGIHPHEAGDADAAIGSTSCASCSRIRRRSPSARPASTTTATTRRATASASCSSASSTLAAELGKPVVDPHPRGRRRDDARRARPASAARSSSTASRPRRCSPVALERGYYVSFAGNVTYPNAAELRDAARARPRRPAPRRDRQPVPRAAAASAAGRTSRRTSCTRSPRSRRRAASRRTSSRRRIDANASAAFGLAVSRSAPKKELGQHFLVDENILGVIGRLAELGPDDVVLEIGPGLGVLTALPRRPRRARPRRRDRPLARAAPPGRPRASRNVELHFGDALRLDLAQPRPAADEARREPAVQHRDADRRREPRRLPSVGVWCVMVQREVADRFFARARRRRPTAPSRCSSSSRPSAPASIRSRARSSGRARTSTRRSSPSAAASCRPSVRAREAARRGRVRAPAQDARRTRSSSPGSPRASPRAAALAALGREPLDPRAEALAPPEFVALTRAAATMSRAPATAKINLALVVGPRRADGKHEVATVLQRIDLADRIALEPAAGLHVEGFADDTLVRRALDAARRRCRRRARWEARIESRSRSPPVSAAAAPTPRRRSRLANATLRPSRSRPSVCTSSPRRLGADVPFFLTAGPQLGEGDGAELTPLDLPQDYWVFLLLPHGDAEGLDGRGLRSLRRARRRRRRLRATPRAADRALRRRAGRATSPRSRRTTSRRRRTPRSCAPLGAFRADVSGAGPAVYGLFHDRERGARGASASWAPRPHLGHGAQRGTVDTCARASRLEHGAPSSTASTRWGRWLRAAPR